VRKSLGVSWRCAERALFRRLEDDFCGLHLGSVRLEKGPIGYRNTNLRPFDRVGQM
jgi:hypothetical protein